MFLFMSHIRAHVVPAVAPFIPRHPSALLIFIPALLITAALHLGRPRRQDAHAVYLIVPPTVDRFSHPWRHPHALPLPTLNDASHRLLYTAPRRPSTLHLGRHVEAVLSDISLAHRLGASYAFPRGPSTSDSVFAWHPGNIRADFVAREVCKPPPNKSPLSRCLPCTALQRPNPLHLRTVLRVPAAVAAIWPHHPARDDALRAFLNGPARRVKHVLFAPVATRAHCPFPAVPSAPHPRATGLVFRRYWAAHGSEALQTVFDSTGSSQSSVPRRKTLPFNPLDLVVALHARRGDRLRRTAPFHSTDLVPTHVYGLALMHVLRIVQRRGGPFSRLRVTVHLYSDGYGNASASAPASTPTSSLERLPEPDGELLSRTAMEELLLPDPDLAPAGLRVVPHIGSPLIDTIHEMASADVVLGSNSRLTTTIVQTISRAAFVLVPVSRYDLPYMALEGRPTNRAYFEVENGDLVNTREVDWMWRQFAFYNGFSAREALVDIQVAKDDHADTPDVDQSGSVINSEEDLGEVSVKNKVNPPEEPGTDGATVPMESSPHVFENMNDPKTSNGDFSLFGESAIHEENRIKKSKAEDSGENVEGAPDDSEETTQKGSSVSREGEDTNGKVGQDQFRVQTEERPSKKSSYATDADMLNGDDEYNENQGSDADAGHEDRASSFDRSSRKLAKKVSTKKHSKKNSTSTYEKHAVWAKPLSRDGQENSDSQRQWEGATPTSSVGKTQIRVGLKSHEPRNTSASGDVYRSTPGDSFNTRMHSSDVPQKSGGTEQLEQNFTSSSEVGSADRETPSQVTISTSSDTIQPEEEQPRGSIRTKKSTKRSKDSFARTPSSKSAPIETETSSSDSIAPDSRGWAGSGGQVKTRDDEGGRVAREVRSPGTPSSNSWPQNDERSGDQGPKMQQSERKVLSPAEEATS